ncbi:Dabb family protein [Candidatus Pseudothioglobus singularis]|nr:Dabb family protein [Candidatus Pseudothioglobus singularis]
MLKHCVFIDFKDEVRESEQFKVFKELANLQDEIKGLVTFEFGNNLDFEQKSIDFNSGFIASFDSYDSLHEYNNNSNHIALGNQLVSMANGGYKGIIVFDIET